METVMIFICNWVVYPMVVWQTLDYAKKSVHTGLNTVDKFIYYLGIVALLVAGWFQ